MAIARETEASISTYLVTVTLVNLGFGLAVAAVMFLLHMPSPLLWGALAALRNSFHIWVQALCSPC